MLKQRALSATIWSGADVFFRQAVAFAVSIALARLLSPEEFGVIAMLYLFTGIASVFVDCGLSTALVQRQEATLTDESTVFWFNAGMGALVAFALWVAAPAISRFYGLPVLVPLTAVLALNILISALGSVHAILLSKRLDFRTQMKIGAIAAVVSGGVAVGMAWQGYGVWALAAQTLVSTGMTTVLLWILSPWRPALAFSRESARTLFGFGGYMLAAGLLDTVYSRAYTLIIGKFFGARELGFYSRADGTKQLPIGVLTNILGRVSFPVFCAVAADKAQLKRSVRLALRGLMLVNVPMMAGLAAIADPLVLALFGEQWLPAVPILQVLCLAGLFWPLHVINLHALMAQGYSNLFFRLEVIKKVVGVGLLLIGSAYGVMGIAWSQVTFGAIAFAINAHYTNRYLDYGVTSQAFDFMPVIGIALPMAVSVYWLSETIRQQMHPALGLLALIAGGTAIFLLLGWVCRLAALRDAIELFRQRNAAAHQAQQTA